jgi:hypothetical protein
MPVVFSFISKRACLFVAGVACGLVAPQIAKSKAARKAAVKVVAKGLKLRDDAQTAVASIREDAEDLYAAETQPQEPAQTEG